MKRSNSEDSKIVNKKPKKVKRLKFHREIFYNLKAKKGEDKVIESYVNKDDKIVIETWKNMKVIKKYYEKGNYDIENPKQFYFHNKRNSIFKEATLRMHKSQEQAIKIYKKKKLTENDINFLIFYQDSKVVYKKNLLQQILYGAPTAVGKGVFPFELNAGLSGKDSRFKLKFYKRDFTEISEFKEYRNLMNFKRLSVRVSFNNYSFNLVVQSSILKTLQTFERGIAKKLDPFFGSLEMRKRRIRFEFKGMIR